MKEADLYRENRAKLLKNALQTKLGTERVMKKYGFSEISVEMPPVSFNPLREDVYDYAVDVDPQFMSGVNHVVDSLIKDLFETGIKGQAIVGKVIFEATTTHKKKDYEKMGKEREEGR